jgi:hypothetical protein
MKRRRWSYVLRYRNGVRERWCDLPYKFEIGRKFGPWPNVGKGQLTVIERTEASTNGKQ